MPLKNRFTGIQTDIICAVGSSIYSVPSLPMYGSVRIAQVVTVGDYHNSTLTHSHDMSEETISV